ncbi:MAG TPA: prolyl oligopeptidase family serine peptidase [Steroidobacteraceae bacterium]|nr:prolyl oligopeptidase family serine peptidase [Steroidobacteraceae bacterium]
MKTDRRIVIRAVAGAVACLSLCAASVFAQAPQGPGPGAGHGAGQGPGRGPGPGGGAFNADPRAETRTYHMDDANTDVQYCVYKSSKVSKNKPAPLIISLHGLGAGPGIMCNKTAVDLAEEGGYILAAPMGYSVSGWYGSPVMNFGGGRGRGPGAGPGAGAAAAAAPAGPSPADIAKWSEEDVMNVLGFMRKEFNVDPQRIYLTGHSMGGAGTWFLGSKHADIWAAIAPVAPASFLMDGMRADVLKGIKNAGVPVLVVQGDTDEAVPVAHTRTWVDNMKELGVDYKYVELPGITHGPVITESQKYVYAFFAEHSKKQ